MNVEKRVLVILLSIFFLGICSSAVQAEEESKLEQMIVPLSNPLNFEDPRIRTEARPIFIYHNLNSDFATKGGNVRVWALPVRVALTDRLGLTASKDGYIQLNADEVVDDDDGSANLEAGLKYALFQDDEEGQILTLGLSYQVATGSPSVFQGRGDGIIRPYLSGAVNLGSVNLVANTDMRISVNGDDSSFWDVSLHFDAPIADFYPSVEFNMYHVYDSGNRLPITGEGADLISFGSSRADGKTTVTSAVGGRYRFNEYVDVGVGYEFALTDNEDVFGWRILTDIVISFPGCALFSG